MITDKQIKTIKETSVGGIAVDQLVSLVQRIERLEEEKSNLNADISEVYAEAKSCGYDVKSLKTIIRIRKMAERDYLEQQEILDIYKNALGMAV